MLNTRTTTASLQVKFARLILTKSDTSKKKNRVGELRIETSRKEPTILTSLCMKQKAAN